MAEEPDRSSTSTASSKAALSRRPRSISPEHKAVLAQARKETRAVRLYLQTVDPLGPSSRDRRSVLEVGFIKVAKSYGQRKGIDYGTWREFGVSARVLKRAGIARAGG